MEKLSIQQSNKKYREKHKDKIRAYLMLWREKNRESIKAYKKANRERFYIKNKEWNKNNRDKLLNYKKRWYKKHRQEILNYHKEYYKNNKEVILLKMSKYAKSKRKKLTEYQSEYRKRRELQDPIYLLRRRLRTRARIAFTRKGLIKNDSFSVLLGCSYEEVRKYLEKQFLEGMSWENYGKWHIDHIKPLKLFNLSLLEEQKKAFNYTNLQPLWAIDNLKKGIKYMGIKDMFKE